MSFSNVLKFIFFFDYNSPKVCLIFYLLYLRLDCTYERLGPEKRAVHYGNLFGFKIEKFYKSIKVEFRSIVQFTFYSCMQTFRFVICPNNLTYLKLSKIEWATFCFLPRIFLCIYIRICLKNGGF